MALRTALHATHRALGGKLVEFAGYEMPVMYSSVLEEHEAVRKEAGVFDVSHMGNLWITGPQAAGTLTRAFVADARKVPEGGTKYTCILRDDGSILDDLYVFHVTGRHHVIPNAGRDAEVAARIASLGPAPVENVSATTAILAVQGPRAAPHVERLVGRSLADVKRFHVLATPELGQDAFVSRTGYTGEDGFELVFPATRAEEVFRSLVDAGVRPCGLGARDTLRLEKGYCLAGNEFAGGRTPLEAGLGWLVDWGHEFAGRPPLEGQRTHGDFPRLVGIKLEERGVPRHGNEVRAEGGRVGEVTSGTMSPTLREGIALAYLDAKFAKVGTAVSVVVREKPLAARVVKLPFV